MDSLGLLTYAQQVGALRTVDTSIVTIATTTETVIGTLTIPANDAQPGSVYELFVGGGYATSATPGNVTMRVRLGGLTGTVIATMAAADGGLYASQANMGITYRAVLTCVSAGTSGAWLATCAVNCAALSNSGFVIRNTALPGASHSVVKDTTISNDLVVTVAHSVATNTLDIFQRVGRKLL